MFPLAVAGQKLIWGCTQQMVSCFTFFYAPVKSKYVSIFGIFFSSSGLTDCDILVMLKLAQWAEQWFLCKETQIANKYTEVISHTKSHRIQQSVFQNQMHVACFMRILILSFLQCWALLCCDREEQLSAASVANQWLK